MCRTFKRDQGKHTPGSLPALTRLRAQYFDGGDAWFTPLFKIAVDQTAWSVAWNSLYYVMLGERAGILKVFPSVCDKLCVQAAVVCRLKRQETVVSNSRK